MVQTQAQSDAGWAIIIAATIALCLALGWVGFIASDDAFYFQGAEHALANPSFAGDSHWTTRFPVIWSFALVIACMGRNFSAFGVMSLGWYVATVVLVAVLTAAIGGRRAGWIAALLTATTSVVVTNASIVNCDLPEAFFLVLGVFLLTSQTSAQAAFIAGVSWGAAVMSRETAVLALFGLLPLFIIGRPIDRHRLLYAAAGVLAILVAEMAFQYAATGLPLRRYSLAFNHDPNMDRAAGAEGNLLIHPLIDPLLVLLVNNEFGLVFWVLPLAIWMQRRRASSPAVVVLAALGTANFIVVSALASKLVLNPRYFTIASIAAIVFVAVWLARLSPGWRWSILLPVIGTSVVLISLQNAHPRWLVEVLPLAARTHPGEIVVADPMIVRRAGLPLRFAHIGNVIGGAPRPGHLYLAADAPQASIDIADFPAPPRPLGRILSALGLARLLPHPIRSRIATTGEAVRLWRVTLPSSNAAAPIIRQSAPR